MKYWIALVFVSITLAGVLLYSAYNKGKEVKEKEWQDKFALYEQQVVLKNDSLDAVISDQQRVIDSLKAIKPVIVTKYIRETAQIDSSLKADSSKENAISLYRTKLSDLDVVPNGLPDLTVREIGFGAKFFVELQEKRELLFNADDVIIKQDDLISTLTDANKGLNQQVQLLRTQISTSTEQEESFWKDRFPVILGGGLGYDVDRKTVVPTVGIFFGIRIN